MCWPPLPANLTFPPGQSSQLGSVFRGTYDFTTEPFDWGSDYSRPEVPYNDLVIYETTVSCPIARAALPSPTSTPPPPPPGPQAACF